MHASLMRRTGAREEITRDNMGHSEMCNHHGDLLQDVVGRAGSGGVGGG